MQVVFQRELGEGWIVESAGLIEKRVLAKHATDESILVAAERGLDVSNHRPRSIRGLTEAYDFDRYLVTDQDICHGLVTVGIQRHRIMILNGSIGIPSPWHRSIEDYRLYMDRLEATAKELAVRLA
jgi:protein-tyrosine-phosphatase